MYAEILIKNAKCMTMNNKEIKDWIAIHQNKIISMGNGKDYDHLINKNTFILDAKGNTILPGFIDSHFHVIQTALDYSSLDLSSAKNFEELGESLKEASKSYSGDYLRAINISEEQFEENRFPGRALLDKYCKDIPVVINSSEYQISILNTYAMLYFKIPFTSEGIDLDSNDMPTGIFRKQANAILRTNILKGISDRNRRNSVSDSMELLLMNGITTVNAMEGGFMYSDKDANFLYEYEDEFPIDISIFYQTMDLNKINDLGLNRVGGCFYIDGTFGARTAALSFEYADCPGTMGHLQFTQEDLNEFVLKCYQNKLQLAVYTIGDRAIELALNAHEAALYQTGITGLRHRLEHVELPNKMQIKRAKDLGIIFSMQPTYEQYWGGPDKLYSKRLGDKYKLTNPFREIIDEGVLICGGSDSNVTDPNPILGIHSAINHPVKKHRVNLYEALKMFTINGAYAIFEEDIKGSLEVGKLADLVMLDSDILATDEDKIKDINVCLTMKSGDILYKNFE